MDARGHAAVAAGLLVAASFLLVGGGPAAGEPPGPFTVLQAAYYSFSQDRPTNQSDAHRVVLLEQSSPAAGPPADILHNASGGLLGTHSVGSVIVVEYQEPFGSNPLASPTAAGRMSDYYQAQLVPTAIFDGTLRVVAFGDDTPQAFENAFAAAASVPAGATIGASGGLVLANGFLDAVASATTDTAGSHVFLRAVLVEDPLPDGHGGPDLRFVARTWLGSLRVQDGHAQGRFNFTVDGSWVASHLGAVLFVQSEGPSEGLPPGGGSPSPNLLESVVLPVSAGVTLLALVSLALWLTRRERSRGR